MRVTPNTPITPRRKERARRIQGIVRSLVQSGFINSKDLPAKMNETDALAMIKNVVGPAAGSLARSVADGKVGGQAQ